MSGQQTYTISPAGEAITCRCCGTTTRNSNDVAELYCPTCKMFHVDYGNMQRILTLVRERADRAEGEEKRLQQALGEQTLRAEILAAQAGGWAAQCAAQVQAAQAYLDALADIPHNGRAIGARVRLAHTIDSDASVVLLAELAAARAAIEGIRLALDHQLPDYRRPLIESALSTYDAKLKRLSLDRGPIAELAELDLSAHDDARRALRAILRARGPDELRLLLREVLEEDGETKARQP